MSHLNNSGTGIRTTLKPKYVYAYVAILSWYTVWGTYMAYPLGGQIAWYNICSLGSVGRVYSCWMLNWLVHHVTNKL